MSKNQFEQLIEYVINDEDAKAKELFHQIVVSKSRQIYENLMAEDNAYGPGMNAMGVTAGQSNEMDEGDDMMMGGSQSGDMIDDVQAEEEGTGMHEAEDEEKMDFDDEAEEAGDDLTSDMEDENDMEDDEAASKSDVMDLSDKLDELMAQFEDMMGGGDMGMDNDMGMDDTGMDDMGMDSDEPEMESGDMFGADEMPADDMGGDQLTVTHKFAEDDERLIREYIEKVNGGFGANIGGDNGVNTKSIVAGKNDMGGTTANIAQGHREVSADIGAKSTVQGNGVMKPNVVPNPDAQGNINVPGGKAGKTSFKTQVKGGGIDRQAGFNKPGQNAGGETGANSRDGEKNTRSTLNARK